MSARGRVLPTRRQLKLEIADLDDKLNQALNELDGLRKQFEAEGNRHGQNQCGVPWGAFDASV